MMEDFDELIFDIFADGEQIQMDLCINFDEILCRMSLEEARTSGVVEAYATAIERRDSIAALFKRNA